MVETANGDMGTTEGTLLAREQVLDALDAELDRLRSEYERPGWTTWALLGSLATTLWLVLAQAEKGGFSLDGVAFGFLVLSLLVETCRGFVRMPELLLETPFASPRVRTFGHLLEGRHATMLLSGAYCCLLALLGYYFRSWIAGPYAIAFTVFYGILAVLGTAAGLVAALLGLPSPERSTRWAVLAFSVIRSALCVGYVPLAIQLFPTLGIDAYRMAGLGWAAVFLARLMAGSGGRPSLVQSIHRLRRDLAFGRITTEDAIRQAELAISGLEVSAYLGMAPVMDRIRQATDAVRLVNARLDQLEAELPEGGSDLTGEQAESVRMVVDSCEPHLLRARELVTSIETPAKRLAWRSHLLARLRQDTASEIELVWSELDSVIGDIDQALEDANERSRRIDAVL